MKTKLIAKYRLKKDLPQLKAGVIFEHREYDNSYPDRGNPGCGVMILGWLNGNCQGGWCGETYILPGQLAKSREWFEPIIEYKGRKPIITEVEAMAKEGILTHQIVCLRKYFFSKQEIDSFIEKGYLVKDCDSHWEIKKN